MKEKERESLTEDLKLLELEVRKDEADLYAIDYKLNSAYEYEEALILRIGAARKATKQLQLQHIDMKRSILKKFDSMKKIMQVWTGNFFND